MLCLARVKARKIVYFEEQISQHIFSPNRSYYVYYSSNILRNRRGFENWGYHFYDTPVLDGDLHSRDVPRPVECE